MRHRVKVLPFPCILGAICRVILLGAWDVNIRLFYQGTSPKSLDQLCGFYDPGLLFGNLSGIRGKLGMKCSLLLVKHCLLLLGPVSLPVRMPWSIQKSL